jgi:hypothetical protein
MFAAVVAKMWSLIIVINKHRLGHRSTKNEKRDRHLLQSGAGCSVTHARFPSCNQFGPMLADIKKIHDC